jgi:RNA polymerase sigma factor (sigma-70 family)
VATAAEPLSQAASFLHFGIETWKYDDGLSAFTGARSRLFGIAYRMLGSAAEADDIVQDVWLHWQSADRSVVENPPAFLATTATRLCINRIKSAHSRLQTYVGTLLPEPAAPGGDPALDVERSEELKLAVLVLLEKLSPPERAAYILREGFDYSYRRISGILQMAETNTRQLVSRARRHIADDRRAPVSSGERRRLLAALTAATENGDMAVLEDFLAQGVLSHRNRSLPFSGNLRGEPAPDTEPLSLRQ